jgi:hypothetical protein
LFSINIFGWVSALNNQNLFEENIFIEGIVTKLFGVGEKNVMDACV